MSPPTAPAELVRGVVIADDADGGALLDRRVWRVLDAEGRTRTLHLRAARGVLRPLTTETQGHDDTE